jgi:hypothetical protein
MLDAELARGLSRDATDLRDSPDPVMREERFW